MRAGLDWLLRDRTSGRIVIGQRPNAPVLVWAASLVVRHLVPDGAVTPVVAVGTVALVLWAADELVRGVNPFRRLLGAGVLVAQGVGLLLG